MTYKRPISEYDALQQNSDIRVLMTGGSGFMGHHAVEHLLKNTKWHIAILDGLSYAGSLNRLQDIEIFPECYKAGRVSFVYHDIRSPISEHTTQLIGSIDFIFHLAAQTHVDRSIENPADFVSTNVTGTFNMLEFARTQKNLRCFIQASTDEVFGPARGRRGFTEWTPYRPSNPYSASKGAADQLVYAWWKTYELPVMIVHTMNCVGERQNEEKFFPKTLRAILQGDQVVLHGTARHPAVRMWLHARNFADALMFVALRGSLGEKYNIVGEELTVSALAHEIAHSAGLPLREYWVDFHNTPRGKHGHDRRYALDGKHLRSLGWVPPVSLEISVAKTVEWLCQHPQWL